MSVSILADALDYFPDFPFKEIVMPVLAITLVLSAIIFYLTSSRNNIKKKDNSFSKPEISKTSNIPFEREQAEQILFRNSQNHDGIFIDDANQGEALTKILQNHSIVCVHGPAGIGKTTLVDEVRFTKLNDHFSLNFRIDLEDVHAPDSLEELDPETSFERAKLRFLSGVGAVGQNADIRTIAQGFLVKTLLFIDNYEQIQACDELDYRIRKELISHFIDNPLVTIVFTSRIKMKSETKNFEVATLQNAQSVNGMTSIDLANHFPAIRLFFKEHNRFATNNNLKRKDFSSEDSSIIIKLCDLVSCLPLGIQLIASRSCEYSLDEILESFQVACKEKRPMGWSTLNERHKSLFNAFYWSFNLLNEHEKELCAHLSLFKNGFFEETIPTWELFSSIKDVRKALKKLHEHSILRKSTHSGEIRYELFVFASEMLIAGVKERNFKFKQGFILNVGKSYNSSLEKAINQIFEIQNTEFDYTDLVENIRFDIENIKYFTKHLFDIGFSSLVTEILCSLEKILFEVGPYVLLKDSFEKLLSSDRLGQLDSIKLRLSYARILKSTRERDNSWGTAEQAFNELRKLETDDSVRELSEAYIKLSYIAEGHNRKELIQTYFSEKTKFDKVLDGIMHQVQAKHYEIEGSLDHAKQNFELAIRFLSGYPLHYGKALNYAGLFYWREGYPTEAEDAFRRAIEAYEKIGAKRWVQGFKTNLALVAADTRKFEEGFEFLNEAQKELKKEGPFEWYHINRLAQARLMYKSNPSEVNLEDAKLILEDCEKIFDEINYGESHVLCLVSISEIQFIQENFTMALDTCRETFKIAEEYELTKMMRVFRSLCIAALSASKLKNSKVAIEYKKLALDLLMSVSENNWLFYSETKILHDQILELDVK